MQDHRSSLGYHGNVCIAGLTAAGKTTHSHLLAGEFGLTYVSASQIELNFLGLSPIQAKDFWITEEAKLLCTTDSFQRIDSELLRIESLSEGCIFDSRAMPWRHQSPALCIWLESSLESRVIKSMVSHRGTGQFDASEYEQLIRTKDSDTARPYDQLFGLDIASDLSPFDLVLDISSLIEEPTLNASLRSIALTRVIRPAVAWYLTGRQDFRNSFEEAVADCPKGVVLHNEIKASQVMTL